MKSEYELIRTPKSHCGACNGALDLLCNDKDPTSTPWFYICWLCKRITQCGVGQIKHMKGQQ